ncbi:beta-sandwich domain-containing protein, partial [Demequina sp. NBRC 110055]|uniref:beta-sandwich domain-containing protein n=1 Tax=Demequina sp. NBRC 110055 TaxID=1570344 RepID=UPI0011868B71
DDVGGVSGVVVDDAGAVVSGASVSVVSEEHEYSVLTQSDGSFAFEDIPAGSYAMTVQKDLFRTATVDGVVVVKGESATVDVTLELDTVGDFFDDFSAGAGAWSPGRGSWSVVDGAYVQSTLGGSSAWRYQSAITGSVWRDATYEADLSYQGGQNWAAVLFRKQAPSDTINDSGYFVAWNHSGLIELDRAGSSITRLASVQRDTDWSVDHHLKVVTTGSNIKVFVDGEDEPIIDVDDDTYVYGYAGVGANGAQW